MCGTSPNHQLIPLYGGILSNLSFFNLLVCYLSPGGAAMCGTSPTTNLSRCIAGLSINLSFFNLLVCYFIPGGSAMCGTSSNRNLSRCIAGLSQSIFLQFVGMLFYPRWIRNVWDKRAPPTYRCIAGLLYQSIFLQFVGMLFYPQVDSNHQLIPLYSGITINLSFFNLLVCYFIPRWTRTTNLQLRRLLLYPIELWGLETYLVNNLIWTLSESNRLPPAYNPAILRD